jgi:hypothetical protein
MTSSTEAPRWRVPRSGGRPDFSRRIIHPEGFNLLGRDHVTTNKNQPHNTHHYHNIPPQQPHAAHTYHHPPYPTMPTLPRPHAHGILMPCHRP